MDILNFVPGEVTLKQMYQVLTHAPPLKIDPRAKTWVGEARRVVDEAILEKRIVYGVNTGFGRLSNKIISEKDLVELQHNLIRSHAAGCGDYLNEAIVKCILFIKINNLAQGYSGVRWELINYLTALYHSDAVPLIPAKGSVGASGDLAPLAHLSLLLLGEGEASHKGEQVDGAELLKMLNLSPLALQPKEGLALINGTQVSTAIFAYALKCVHQVMQTALIAGGLSMCAVNATLEAFDPRVHIIRKLSAQFDVADAIFRLTQTDLQKTGPRLQDPYSIRCQPQVIGACLQVLRQAAKTLKNEMNAVTDNPLVFSKTNEILSGGNFHAEPIAFAADQLALVIAEMGNLSERRINMLCESHLSGLPEFLVKEPGLNSGFMILHVTAAALCSENKVYAHPASVDNVPTSGNQEDHVSMATAAAYKLLPMIENLMDILSIELISACQGIDLSEKKLSKGLVKEYYEMIRNSVPFCTKDRFLAPNLKEVKECIRAGNFTFPLELYPNIDVFKD